VADGLSSAALMWLDRLSRLSALGRLRKPIKASTLNEENRAKSTGISKRELKAFVAAQPPNALVEVQESLKEN